MKQIYSYLVECPQLSNQIESINLSLYCLAVLRRRVSPVYKNHLCVIATQLLSNKCCSGGEPLATLCPILACPIFKPQTICSIDECVTARPGVVIP